MSKKGGGKKPISFTVDKSILENFDSHCEEHSINKSSLVQKLIANYIKENGKPNAKPKK